MTCMKMHGGRKHLWEWTTIKYRKRQRKEKV